MSINIISTITDVTLRAIISLSVCNGCRLNENCLEFSEDSALRSPPVSAHAQMGAARGSAELARAKRAFLFRERMLWREDETAVHTAVTSSLMLSDHPISITEQNPVCPLRSYKVWRVQKIFVNQTPPFLRHCSLVSPCVDSKYIIDLFFHQNAFKSESKDGVYNIWMQDQSDRLCFCRPLAP